MLTTRDAPAARLRPLEDLLPKAPDTGPLPPGGWTPDRGYVAPDNWPPPLPQEDN